MTAYSSRFTGKTAIITGAGTGMGKAGALRLAREGANIVLAGRRQNELDAVAREIAATGGSALTVATDISDERQVEALVAKTLDSFGRLDIAWNNAGALGGFAPLHQLDLDGFDALIAINLRGTLACLKHEIAAMLDHGGAIVNTSSWTAHGSMPGTTAYAASKAALEGVVGAAALEVGERSIRINNISPGMIATPMSRGAVGDDEAMRPFSRHAALRRIGEPEDVADAALWLLSDDARFVTGQSMVVDGGLTIAGPRPW